MQKNLKYNYYQWKQKKLPAHPARVIVKDVYCVSFILFVVLFRFLTALFLALPLFLSCDQFLFSSLLFLSRSVISNLDHKLHQLLPDRNISKCILRRPRVSNVLRLAQTVLKIPSFSIWQATCKCICNI